MNEPTQAVQLFPQREVATTGSGSIEVASARAAQEVQAAMVVAKKFPRDETKAFARIMKSCSRPTLAEVACYAYPRGGQTVTGPSIRLAETIAQNWGNIDFGIVELEQRHGESQVMAYAWDLETNTRQTKIFTVKHERRVKQTNVALDDPRDIYEMTANQGARRLRACILGVIPGDLVDAAVGECEKTLKTGNTEPLTDRVRKMVAAFSTYGVTQLMIEARVGHNADVINETELVNLRKIYVSLKDGMSKREDWFKPEATRPDFTKPADPSDDGDLGPATPKTSEPRKKVAEKPEPKPVTAASIRLLMKMAKGVTEPDVMAYLLEVGKTEESLSSLDDVEQVAPITLQWLADNWQEVATAIRKVKGGAK